MLIAGGTDLLPNMKRRHQTPKVLVSLRGVASLKEFANGSGLTLGAGLTLTEVVGTRTCANTTAALRQAAAQIATPHLRNMGTLGGNLCLDTRCTYYNQNYEWRQAIDFCLKKDGETCWVATASKRCVAVSSTDTAPALIALGAKVQPGLGRGRARDSARRPLQERRHRLSVAQAGRDSDRRHAAGATAGRAPTGSCAGAARSISRSSASPLR